MDENKISSNCNSKTTLNQNQILTQTQLTISKMEEITAVLLI